MIWCSVLSMSRRDDEIVCAELDRVHRLLREAKLDRANGGIPWGLIPRPLARRLLARLPGHVLIAGNLRRPRAIITGERELDNPELERRALDALRVVVAESEAEARERAEVPF